MLVERQARNQPSDNRESFFSQILDLFQALKIGVPSGCLEETSIFKIVMIDDVKARIFSLFHRRKIIIIIIIKEQIKVT